MQKASLKLDDSDDNVPGSWEELDDLITIPEPQPKPTVSLKKKESPKPLNPPSASTDAPRSPATSQAPQSSSGLPPEPEIGRVRILKRNPVPATSTTVVSSPAGPLTKTYEERVRNYNEARMRILGSIDDEVQSQLTAGDGEMSSTNAATPL